MVLALADSADVGIFATMSVAGYALCIRESDWYGHRLLRGPETNFNPHVFSLERPEIDRLLLNRDWFRSTDADCDLNEPTKRELAKRTWKYVQNYPAARPVVEGNHRACPRRPSFCAEITHVALLLHSTTSVHSGDSRSRCVLAFSKLGPPKNDIRIRARPRPR